MTLQTAATEAQNNSPAVQWIHSTAFHAFMVKSPVAFTAAQTVHFMGIALLIGSLLFIDLRGLGLFKHMPFHEVHKLVPFAIIGFAIQLITGICFVFAGPENYFFNLSFQVKMVLVVLAGVNALVFEFFVFRPYEAGNRAIESAPVTRITSAASIVIWLLVLICGRLIAYA